MSTFITPTLVRRYLKATGWTLETGNDPWWYGTSEDGETGRGFPDSWVERDPLDADVLGRITGTHPGLFRLSARLGMLASAEMALDAGTTWERDRVLRRKMIEAAGVDHTAWDATR